MASPSLPTQINQVAPGVGNLFDAVLTTNDRLANPWVKYSEGFKAGFMVVDFNATRVQADWHHTDSTKPNAPVAVAASYQSVAGSKKVTKAAAPLA